jgi:hypothetical protein
MKSPTVTADGACSREETRTSSSSPSLSSSDDSPASAQKREPLTVGCLVARHRADGACGGTTPVAAATSLLGAPVSRKESSATFIFTVLVVYTLVWPPSIFHKLDGCFQSYECSRAVFNVANLLSGLWTAGKYCGWRNDDAENISRCLPGVNTARRDVDFARKAGPILRSVGKPR